MVFLHTEKQVNKYQYTLEFHKTGISSNNNDYNAMQVIYSFKTGSQRKTGIVKKDFKCVYNVLTDSAICVLLSITLDIPKSPTFTSPDFVRKILRVLMSLYKRVV